MAKKINKRKKIQKKIAKKRIIHLFTLAENSALSNRLKLSDRYVFLARKISMRYLVPIPKEFKRVFCKNCYRYLLINVNSRVRINNGKIVTYCFNCKKYSRIPLNKKSIKQ